MSNSSDSSDGELELVDPGKGYLLEPYCSDANSESESDESDSSSEEQTPPDDTTSW